MGKQAGHLGHQPYLVLHKEFVELFAQKYPKFSPRSFPEWQVFSPNVKNKDASLVDCHSVPQCHWPSSRCPPCPICRVCSGDTMSLTQYWCGGVWGDQSTWVLIGALHDLPALRSSTWCVFVPPRNGRIKDSTDTMDLTTGPSMSGADI